MIWLRRLWRYYFVLLFFSLGWKLTTMAYASGMVMALGYLLFAVPCLILGCMMVLPEAMAIVLRPLFGFIDSFYLPGGDFLRPPLDYRLAEFYGDRMLFHKAADAYEHILEYYPGESQAYLRLVEIYDGELGLVWPARRLMWRARFYLTRANHSKVTARRLEILNELRRHPREVEEMSGAVS